MKKTLLTLLIFIQSCNSQNINKWNMLVDLIKHENYCIPCTQNLLDKNLRTYLLDELNKSFDTNKFNDLEYSSELTFSYCKESNNINKKEYYDCFNIIKFKTKNEYECNNIYELIQKIPNKTIHFKPPSNWVWFKKDKHIFLIYSMYYQPNEHEFKNIIKKFKKIYEK